MLNLRGVGSLQEAIGRSSAGSKFAKRAEGSISSAKRPRVSDYLGGHNAGETDAAAAAVAGGTPRSPCQQDPTEATAPASCIASLPDPDRAHAKDEELDTAAAAAAVLKAASAAAEGPYTDMARGSSRDGPPKQGRQQQQQQQHQRWTQSTAVVRIETLCVGMRHHRHHHRQQDSGSKVMAVALRPAGMTVHGGGGGHAAEDSGIMVAAPSPPLQAVRAAGEGDGYAVDDGAAWAVTALRREPCNPYDSNAILVSGGIGALSRLSGLEGG